MPKFAPMDPSEVVVGRGRSSAEARKPYAEALLASDAGKIELERGEKASTVKRYLQVTAKEHGLRIRSNWTDGKEQVLLWKKVGS